MVIWRLTPPSEPDYRRETFITSPPVSATAIATSKPMAPPIGSKAKLPNGLKPLQDTERRLAAGFACARPKDIGIYTSPETAVVRVFLPLFRSERRRRAGERTERCPN